MTYLDQLKKERAQLTAIYELEDQQEVGDWTPGMIITRSMYLQMLEDALKSLTWMINYLSHHET